MGDPIYVGGRYLTRRRCGSDARGLVGARGGSVGGGAARPARACARERVCACFLIGMRETSPRWAVGMALRHWTVGTKKFDVIYGYTRKIKFLPSLPCVKGGAELAEAEGL